MCYWCASYTLSAVLPFHRGLLNCLKTSGSPSWSKSSSYSGCHIQTHELLVLHCVSWPLRVQIAWFWSGITVEKHQIIVSMLCTLRVLTWHVHLINLMHLTPYPVNAKLDHIPLMIFEKAVSVADGITGMLNRYIRSSAWVIPVNQSQVETLVSRDVETDMQQSSKIHLV